jgi:ABC-2 type transport system ATP-binding protein
MGASQFVGRVGGLALALGIGAGVFAGSAGVAWAEESARDSGTTGSSADSGSDSSQAGPSTRGRTTTAVRGSAAAEPAEDLVGLGHAGQTAPATPADEPISRELEAIVDPEPVVEAAVEDVTGVAVAEPQPADADPVTVDQPGTELPTAVALQTTADAAVTSAPTAKADSGPLTAAPKTIYYDGVVQGNLNVTSSSGCGELGSTCTLVYSFVDSTDGGKVTLGKVPFSLPGLPDDAQGGPGSYTFLPYATWIDPDDPTKDPIPTGSQGFTVRISENTQFNQVMTSIPLIGMIAEPTIKFLQELPFLGALLAPLIGASLTVKVETDLDELAAGKQVAYTYTVSSFDGTPISMNYFPASATSQISLTGLQATIFNGPGLGSPGETNPYGLFQAAGSVPGLALMRGQGLPDLVKDIPLGFNVITWDPRGEFASGGVLQLDNPFFEGRDVSSLIDWAEANTPLLLEGGKPSIAMMGGSYGGGIQMTTIDPRVKVVVPSIGWNSLNSSLYPTDVFKTAWANTLALALLEAGATVNPLINQGILYGNLFGFLTEEQQAALASSGPTALLTKLSIPTMYDQGIIDALFPLQQAVDNAQTQLEQNPFFAGVNAELVKMIWFCGGHGVCTTQSAAQQTKQNTIMFLQNMLWVNAYAKDYLKPALNTYLSFIPPFQWWDQVGGAWTSAEMPWTGDFATGEITGGNLEGGRLNSFTSKSGPLTASDAAGAVCEGLAQACEFPLNQVFATEAKNAVEVLIPIPASTLPPIDDEEYPETFIVGAPLVSFSYSGIGNAKAVYAQIVDTATGQVLGNINTAIPVTLDGKDHQVVDFAIANIAYSGPLPSQDASALKLQIVANSSLYQNNAVIWSVDISDVSVKLPTTDTANPNFFAALPI